MNHRQIVYVGTYTQQMSHVPESIGKGIHLFAFDPTDGTLVDLDKIYDGVNPSYLSISRDQHHLYAGSEVGDGNVSAFAIDSATGDLRRLNQQPTHGSATAYVSVDRKDKFVFAANYWDGQSIVMYPTQSDGSLAEASSMHEHTMPAAGTVPSRQDKSHAHCAVPTPDNRFLLVCDLGLDKIMLYRIDAENERLVPHDPPYIDAHPGAGPRHLAFHPSGDYVYVANELDSSVSVFAFDAADCQLDHQQTISMLPPAFTQHSTASDIHVSSDGKHLYAANRGHDSLVIYEIQPETGQLVLIDHQSTGGKTPRNFVVDSSGENVLVANQDSHNIVSFRRDSQTGLLTRLSTIECPTPVCLKIATLSP